MGANQPPSRKPGRPRTNQNAGSARGELARWLCEVAARDPTVVNSAIAVRAGVTDATVGRALRGETFASEAIVDAVVELGHTTDHERTAYIGWIATLAALDARYGRQPLDELPPPPWAKAVRLRGPEPRRRTILAVCAAVVALVAAVAVGMVLVTRSSDTAAEVHAEQVANRTGTPTFADPIHGSGETGPRIPASAVVQVSCKVYAPIFASVSPDGYWYRIDSAPWSGRFYAAANTFANGDQPGAIPPTNTDRSVPDC